MVGGNVISIKYGRQLCVCSNEKSLVLPAPGASAPFDSALTGGGGRKRDFSAKTKDVPPPAAFEAEMSENL